jgi:hypothetical protein
MCSYWRRCRNTLLAGICLGLSVPLCASSAFGRGYSVYLTTYHSDPYLSSSNQCCWLTERKAFVHVVLLPVCAADIHHCLQSRLESTIFSHAGITMAVWCGLMMMCT